MPIMGQDPLFLVDAGWGELLTNGVAFGAAAALWRRLVVVEDRNRQDLLTMVAAQARLAEEMAALTRAIHEDREVIVHAIARALSSSPSSGDRRIQREAQPGSPAARPA